MVAQCRVIPVIDAGVFARDHRPRPEGLEHTYYGPSERPVIDDASATGILHGYSETSKYPNPDIRLPSACIWIRIRIFLPIFGFGFGLEARIR